MLQQLKAIIETFGVPNVFYTRRYADYHWPMLRKLLFPDGYTPTQLEMRKAVIANPHLATAMYENMSIAYRNAFNKLFKTSWMWERAEFQFRNADHTHGLAQMEHCPKMTELADVAIEKHRAEKMLQQNDDAKSDVQFSTQDFEDLRTKIQKGQEACETIKSYGEWLVSCENPALDQDGNDNNSYMRPLEADHPCKREYECIDDFDQDYCDLINLCQVHKCISLYCLRKKGTGIECRFKFPKTITHTSKIVFKEKWKRTLQDKTTQIIYECQLELKRNDPRMNQHNIWDMQTWRANTDFTLVLSTHHVVEYVAKYITKAEPRSSQLSQLLRCTADMQGEESANTVLRKAMMRMVGNRDMGANEVARINLGLHLHSSTHMHFDVNIYGSRQLCSNLFQLDDNAPATYFNFVDVYGFRMKIASGDIRDKIENIHLQDFASKYRIEKGKIIERSKVVVPVFAPHYSHYPKADSFCKHCKMLLIKYVP